MRVHCLIPVHNRIRETEAVLRCLNAQDYPHLRVVIVDDGSTDGTADMVRRDFPHVELLSGDGNLWWSGAMARGLRLVLPQTKDGDFVLFQNNDTLFERHYVRTLVSASEALGRAVVGSILKDAGHPDRIISLGPRVSYLKAYVREVLPEYQLSQGDGHARPDLPELIDMDALSGRGTLYPVEVFHRVGIVRHRWLPHYLADYEMAARARAAGFRTVVCTRAVVWTSAEESGIACRNAPLTAKLFGRRSRSNIVDAVVFFSLSGPWYLRITAPARVPLFRLWGAARHRIAGWWR